MERRKRNGPDGVDGNWTCGVVLQTSKQVVMVKEDVGREPILFKIPGGRKRPVDKTPEETAIREVLEETGIRVAEVELEFVLTQDRRNHLYHLYTVKIDEKRLEERYRIAKNGEEVHLVNTAELRPKQAEILPHHFQLLESRNLALRI